MNRLSVLCNTLVSHGLLLITLFFLLLWLVMRPLGVSFLAILTAWLFLTQFNLRVLPPPEFMKKMEQLKCGVQNLYQTKPKMFYLYSSSCLCLLAALGHYLSEVTVIILGMLLSSLLLGKYRFRIIKIESKVAAASPVKSIHEVDIDDEFMPEENESNLYLLERASDLVTSIPLDETEEEKSDEIPTELLIPDTIPEIDETYTDDDCDIDDLVPILNTKTKATSIHRQVAIPNPSNEGSASDAYRMDFKKGHFKNDSSLSTTSSSSDEESLSKGLKFPDHSTIDGGGGLRQGQLVPSANTHASDLVALALHSQSKILLEDSNSVLPSLLSGLGRVLGKSVGTGGSTNVDIVQEKRIVTALDSSDESDFEILGNDDFQ